MKKNCYQKTVVLGLVLVMLVSIFTGCGKKENEEKMGGTLNIGVTSFADTLEPTEQYFSWVITRYGIGETLVKFDENGELTGCLAEEWSVSDDKLTWTFKIRDGVKFSNGTELTAEGVKSSLERTFEMNDRAGSAFFTYTSMETDGQNLVITTEKPNAGVAGSLADPLFLIVDTTADTDSFALEGPICTGPYKVEEFEATNYCTVVRNEYYWDGEVPLDKVVFKCIDDQTTRSMALQTGEIDVAYNLKVENAADFESDEYVIQKLASLRSSHAFMNQKGALGDKVLRQAVLRALDRDTYCNVLLEGGATPGKAPVPPSLDFGFDELKDENAYNPESAKKILAEAGYADNDGDGYLETPNGEVIDLHFVIYNSREELSIYAQATQASLKDIGIKVTIDTVSYETLLDIQEAGDYDLLIWNVLAANTGDPEKYLRESWMTRSESNKNNNYAGYSNQEVDRLLEELSSEFDSDKRREKIVKIQQLIMDDAATIFFGYETTYLFSNAKVKDLKMYPMDYYWLTKDVYIAE
ncbi:MAG: ABC transporter substrate-binding protein [Anaerovoracaceae bacterium]